MQARRSTSTDPHYDEIVTRALSCRRFWPRQWNACGKNGAA
jgi:hypothetical protein